MWMLMKGQGKQENEEKKWETKKWKQTRKLHIIFAIQFLEFLKDVCATMKSADMKLWIVQWTHTEYWFILVPTNFGIIIPQSSEFETDRVFSNIFSNVLITNSFSSTKPIQEPYLTNFLFNKYRHGGKIILTITLYLSSSLFSFWSLSKNTLYFSLLSSWTLILEKPSKIQQNNWNYFLSTAALIMSLFFKVVHSSICQKGATATNDIILYLFHPPEVSYFCISQCLIRDKHCEMFIITALS